MTHHLGWDEDQKRAYYELMREIQETDFVLVELNLYLDTHPEDQNAIHQFNQFVQKSTELKTKFQSAYGPLFQFGNSYSPVPFLWKEAPWPWQL